MKSFKSVILRTWKRAKWSQNKGMKKIIEVRAEIKWNWKTKNWYFEKTNTFEKLLTSHPLGWLLQKKKVLVSIWINWNGEHIDKLEYLCIVRGIVKWENLYGRQYKISSKDPAIPLLSAYAELKSRSWRDICLPMLVAALFTVSREVVATQILTDRWMDKQNVIHTYSRILFIPKRESNPVICYNMDKPWGHYVK